MKLSIITTMYYSQSYINEFYDRISLAAKKITNDYEIIFVDDGSPDHSLQVAVDIQRNDKRVKVIELSRNFGHYKAIMTGLAQAQGDFVFLIDCDLEEDPALLENFFARITQDNCDVVYGYQEKRKGGWSEKFFGAVFYKLQNFISGIPFPKNTLTVRLMKKKYVQNLIKYKEQESFLSGLCYITGFYQIGIPVKKGHKGTTTYNFSRKIAIAINSITSFSNKPLVLIFYVGSLISFVSGFYITYLLIRHYFFSVPITGWTSLIVSIWLLGGLIIFFMGIIGIYLSKIFIETKNRPYTIVKNFYQSEEFQE